ncbi:MAG: hypothetical protein ACPG31_10965 [Planctomycetota bacterium]
MFTYSFPVLAACLLVAVQMIVLFGVLRRLPKREESAVKRWLRRAFLIGPLAGLLILIDYGHWQEDFATRGMQRRAHSVTAYLDFVARTLAKEDYTNASADVALVAAREQYGNLSAVLVEDDGVALPEMSIPPELRGPGADAEARLRFFLLDSRLIALRSQLLMEEPSRGPMVYLRDRILR